MTRPLVLFGAGGLARETAELVRAHHRAGDLPHRYRLVGLLDDDPARHGHVLGGLHVLGGRDWLDAHADVDVAVCVAHPRRPLSRLGVVRSLRLGDHRHPPLIHSHASLAVTTDVGAGSIVHAGVVATADVTIGRHVVLMPSVVLTHDVVVGDGATVAAGALLAGGVHVDEGAYVGAGAAIREGCHIGAGATVGMGAVVTHDVHPGTTCVGNPARPLTRPTPSPVGATR